MGKKAERPKRHVLSFRVTDEELREILEKQVAGGRRLGNFLHDMITAGIEAEELLSSLADGFRPDPRGKVILCDATSAKSGTAG